MPSSRSHLQHAFFGERGGAVLFVDGVIAGGVFLARLLAFDHFAALQVRDDLVGLVVLVGRFLAGAGNDQRRAGFVDQDRIDFVDDGEVVAALHAVLQVELHVVAQVIEAELVIGAVGDVGSRSLPGAPRSSRSCTMMPTVSPRNRWMRPIHSASRLAR